MKNTSKSMPNHPRQIKKPLWVHQFLVVFGRPSVRDTDTLFQAPAGPATDADQLNTLARLLPSERRGHGHRHGTVVAAAGVVHQERVDGGRSSPSEVRAQASRGLARARVCRRLGARRRRRRRHDDWLLLSEGGSALREHHAQVSRGLARCVDYVRYSVDIRPLRQADIFINFLRW